MVKLPPIINHCYLMVTENCPNDCEYCYLKDRRTHNEFPFEWMPKIKNMFTCYNKPRLIFFGGEPLVKTKLIKKIVKEYSNDFQFQVVTSGVVNFEEFMDDVYEPNKTNFDVQISWDGNVKTRPMHSGLFTYDSVYESIIKQLEKGRILVGRAVLNEESIKKFYETYLTYKELNKKYRFGGDFTIAHQIHFLDSFYKDIENQLSLIYNDIKEDLDNNLIPYIPDILLKYMSNIIQNIQAISCDVGTHVVIKPNGDIYPCTILSQKDERFKLGNINDSDVDTEIINDLRYKSQCNKDCPARTICDGGCRFERIIHFPNDWKCNVCNHTCSIYKTIYEVTSTFLNNLSKDNLEKIYAYMNQYNMFRTDYDNCKELNNQERMLHEISN